MRIGLLAVEDGGKGGLGDVAAGRGVEMFDARARVLHQSDESIAAESDSLGVLVWDLGINVTTPLETDIFERRILPIGKELHESLVRDLRVAGHTEFGQATAVVMNMSQELIINLGEIVKAERLEVFAHGLEEFDKVLRVDSNKRTDEGEMLQLLDLGHRLYRLGADLPQAFNLEAGQTGAVPDKVRECLVVEMIVHPCKLDALEGLAFDGEEHSPDIILDQIGATDPEMNELDGRVARDVLQDLVLELSGVVNQKEFYVRAGREYPLEVVGFES